MNVSQGSNIFFLFFRRQDAIVEQIFDPMAFQCTNCGLRYSPNDAMAYKQHKDWHFRMNKNKQTQHKKAQSRRWYLKNSDWIISHEIEDHIGELQDDDADNEPMEEVVPTVPKSSNPAENTCPVCKEDFVEVYKEENPDLEDDDDGGVYHLQNAIRPQGPGTNTYHPQCYEDASKIGNESLDRLDSMEESYEVGPQESEPKIDEQNEKANDDEAKVVEATEDVEMKEEVDAENIKAEDENVEPVETDVKPSADDSEKEAAEEGAANADQEGTDEEVKKEVTDETTNDSVVEDENKLDETLNLTADAGVSQEFSYPIASGIKINLTSQVRKNYLP